MTVHEILDPTGLTSLPSGPVDRLAPEAWAMTRPDLHLAASEADHLLARASVWWSSRPSDPENPESRVGMIGHLDGSDDGAVSSLLVRACSVLRERGCDRVVGPMDGSPWHAYRVVSEEAPEGEVHPPFALEPSPPIRTRSWLEAERFEEVAGYHSALVPRLPDREEALRDRTGAAEAHGVTLRPFDPERAEPELDALYRISLESFARNPFYVPIPREAFLASYRPLVQRVDPRLIVVAERGGEAVGVCFGLPDLAQVARGEAIDTVVVKTVAVLPEMGGRGLGSLLVLAVEEAARRAGLSRSIHALMYDGNRSVRISRQSDVRVIRRYALLGRAV